MRSGKDAEGVAQLYIHPDNAAFARIYFGTTWEGGQVCGSLQRLPGASRKRTKDIRIGLVKGRAISVPIDVEKVESPLSAPALSNAAGISA